MIGSYQDVFIFNISTNRLDGANKIQPPLHEGFKDCLIFLQVGKTHLAKLNSIAHFE
jgi:hypothetical protein